MKYDKWKNLKVLKIDLKRHVFLLIKKNLKKMIEIQIIFLNFLQI